MSEVVSPGRPRWQIVAVLMLIATTFGSNHIAARFAFDHGTSVFTAVLVRSVGTALVLALAMRIFGVPLAVPRLQFGKAAVAGLLVTVQSLCLYSAVARIPVGLALLTFNTFPFVFALLAWLMDGRRPSGRTLGCMALALAGLSLALSFGGGAGTPPAAQMAIGVALSLGASLSFAIVLYLSQRWLGTMDGRMRSLIMMATTSVAIGIIGFVGDSFRLPADATGWTGLALLTILYGTAFTALFVVLPRYGMLDNAGVLNFEPVAALTMGALFLGQMITPVQILGAGMVLAAMLGFASEGKRPKAG